MRSAFVPSADGNEMPISSFSFHQPSSQHRTFFIIVSGHALHLTMPSIYYLHYSYNPVAYVKWIGHRHDNADLKRSINHALTSCSGCCCGLVWSPKNKSHPGHRHRKVTVVWAGCLNGYGSMDGWTRWKVLDHLMGWCAWKVVRKNGRKSIALFHHCP